MSAATAQFLRQAMADVVGTPPGTGYRYVRTDKIACGGKTGTAETGRRAPDGKRLNHAWFAGFAPVRRPRIAVVVVKELVRGRAGAEAGPVAKSVFEAAADLFNL
jgi:cell division protein FtsI/penicillin-binding protein 2